jgi:glycine/D-amino acid oxidase-like deaminating enzyme
LTTSADLIIVGAGLAGSAAAWSASARGLDVVVLEAFGPGHKNGSSHGSARIFRRAYADPLYVRLTGAAGELWRQLEEQAGEPLVTLTGGLDFGAAREPRLLHEILTGCGVPAELLPPEEAARRWPYFDFTGAGEVLFHAEAGPLDPHNAMAAMLRLAAARGADVRFNTPVTRLEPAPSGDGAVAHTDSGSFTAPVIAVAVGGWIAPLLAGVADLPPLTVTQQQIAHFAPVPAPVPAPGDPWPIFIYKDGDDDYYGLPGGRDGAVPGEITPGEITPGEIKPGEIKPGEIKPGEIKPGAIKIGEHPPIRPTTAADRDFEIDPAAQRRLVGFVGRRIPGLTAAPFNEATCLYTRTANEDFILDRSGPFVVASPCSGHGAKFAPLLGEIIADLAAGKPGPDPRFTIAAHGVTRA